MHIGISISLFGHHPAAWQNSSSANAIHFSHLAGQVKKAQEGKLDFVLLADQLGKRPVNDLSPLAIPFEPTTLIAALATIVREIGLIATADLGQHEPYNLARRFASLDTISRGRAGWNLVAPPDSIARSAEYIDVVNGLWDSWEDDAFVYDKVKGRFFEPEKMHVLAHKGENFTVRGPLNVNRSPQGKPIITTVLNPQTLDLAVQKADVIFIDTATVDQAKAILSSLDQAFERSDRVRADVRILANVVPYIGATKAAGEGILEMLDRLAPGAGKPAGIELIGTSVAIADRLEEWSEIVDGFTILPPLIADGIDTFVDDVIPELRRRGLFRDGYRGQTLREHLNLPRPLHPASMAAESVR